MSEENGDADAQAVAAERDSAATSAEEQTSRLQSEFLSNMSDAIRTPMGAMLRTIELLLDTDLDEEQGEYAASVRENGRDLLGVINDMLDFSRVRAGALELERIPFDVKVVLEQTIDRFAQEASRKHLELELDIGSGITALPHCLEGDPGQLRQILANFVSNAIGSTEKGRVVLRATCLERESERCRIRFEVEDTGIGMTPEQADRIFEGFVEPGGGPVAPGDGVGPGLVIARQLAGLLGGSVEVESRLGAGSTFSAEIPFAVSEQELASAESDGAEPDIYGLRVLVVAPDGRQREQLSRHVEHARARVDIADGIDDMATRMRVAREQWTPIDVVMALVEGPDRAAGELIAAARAEMGEDAIPCVAVSSAGQRGDAPHLEQLGYRGYLTTPVDSRLLPRFLGAVHASRNDEDGRIHTKHSAVERPVSASPSEPAVDDERVRVLLAEQPCGAERALRAALEKHGCCVVEAGNGIEALDLLTSESFDLVFLSSHMPEMDGFAAARAIRSLPEPRLARIPIIGLAPPLLRDERDLCIEAGMNECLNEPVDPAALDEMLVRWRPGRTAS